MANAATISKESGHRTTEAPVTDNAAEAAHRAVSGLAEKSAAAEKSIRQTAEKTQEKARVKAEDAREQVGKTISSVESYARENPLAAAGIAFGAGILASMILRR